MDIKNNNECTKTILGNSIVHKNINSSIWNKIYSPLNTITRTSIDDSIGFPVWGIMRNQIYHIIFTIT